MKIPQIDHTHDLKITLSHRLSPLEALNLLRTVDTVDSEVLFAKNLANEFKRNFPLNSRLVELIKQNELKVYSSDEEYIPTAILQNASVYYFAYIGATERFIKLPNEEFAADFATEHTHLVNSAEEITLHTPAWHELLDQLERIVGSPTREEFERIIQAAQLEDLGALDGPSVALIAAAQSGALMYDLGKWGEEVGIASKATFSRRKKILEDDGIISTEKVPVDVGRPRLRLQLAENINKINIKIGVEDDALGIVKSPGTNEPTPTSDTAEKKSRLSGEEFQKNPEEEKGDILTTIEEEIENVIRES